MGLWRRSYSSWCPGLSVIKNALRIISLSPRARLRAIGASPSWILAHYASDKFFNITSDFMGPEICHKRGGTGADPQTDRTVNGAAAGSVHTQNGDIAAADEDGDDFFGDRDSHFEPLARSAIRQIELRLVVRVSIGVG